MTIEELTQAQEKLHEEITAIAKNKKLYANPYKPIYDGVGNIPAYINSPLRIMWILKESYDRDKQGNIGFGDWCVYEPFYADDAWTIMTYKALTYILYGYKNNLSWETLPNIRDHKDLIKILDSVAYINLNKMPAKQHSQSYDYDIYEQYLIWKEIINKQINVYSPDVIIMGGTKRFFDFGENKLSLVKTLGEVKKVEIYKYGNQWLLSAHHPSRYTGEYIDGLIDALHFVSQQIKKDK